jgi:hypothetical protein
MARGAQKLGRSRVAAATAGIIIFVLGAIFVGFAIAPVLVPGGVPTGPLEFGGKVPNALELVSGAVVMLAGIAIRKFAYRHVAILAGGVILVFFLSIIAVLSSLNSNLTLTTIDITVQYGNHDQGYFGPARQTWPITGGSNSANQNLTVDEMSPLNVSFPLQESSLASGDDSITSIKAQTAIPGFAFQITSIEPSLPVTFSPGKAIQFKLSLLAPGYSTGQSCPPQYCLHGEYFGPISLVLTTTGG